MINRQLSLILAALAVVAGLVWFYGKKDSARLDRKREIEERLSKIHFTAESLLPTDSVFLTYGSPVTLNLYLRKQITNTTFDNAESYLNALVVGLIQATYRTDISNIEVEIAQFASPNDAYGFYSQKRPPGVAFDSAGAESYYFQDTLHFTKSSLVVSITSTLSNDKYTAIKKAAGLIESKIDSPALPPLSFRLFPYRDQLVPSQRYYSLGYLGVEGIDEVFTVDYAVAEDTLTLFLTTDTAGSKFLKLSEYGHDISQAGPAPREFEYPEAYSLSFEHPDYGRIAAFLANRKLVGVIGYNRATGIELCTMWIKGLQ